MKAREMTRKNGVVVAASLVLCTLAVDSRALINYSNNPDLAQAMQFDPETNGGNRTKADRAQAERHYLRYLQDANDSFQKAHVYCQLGALYAVSFTREKGEEPNYVKARQYYKKVLEFEPQRLGRPTMVARSMLVGFEHPPGMERIKAEMEFYTWLASWDEAKIGKLWLPEWKPGTRRPALPAWIKDANEAVAAQVRAHFDEEKQPSESDVRGTLNALVDYKEVAILNAATDAARLPKPEEGFQYIRAHMAPDAPEQQALNKIIRRANQRAVDEAAQAELNSLPLDPRKQDVNAVFLRDLNMGAGAPDRPIRRRFIPEIKFAAPRKMPFLLHLKSGVRSGAAGQETMSDAQLYEVLAQTRQGDLAWDGRFLTMRGARLFSAREEVGRPLQYASTPSGGAYELPRPLVPPYTLYAFDWEGTYYLIKVIRTVPDGVDIFYRALAPTEVPDLLAPQAEK